MMYAWVKLIYVVDMDTFFNQFCYCEILKEQFLPIGNYFLSGSVSKNMFDILTPLKAKVFLNSSSLALSAC